MDGAPSFAHIDFNLTQIGGGVAVGEVWGGFDHEAAVFGQEVGATGGVATGRGSIQGCEQVGGAEGELHALARC